MWRHILLLGVLIASTDIGRCNTVRFTVDPANIGVFYEGGSVDLFSSDLNGTVLAGQSLALDLVLSEAVLARIFPSNPSAFGILLNVHTNAPTFPGFAGPTTGFVLGPDGHQLGDSQIAGRSAGSDGTFAMGLVSFMSDRQFDMSGVHFDTRFPETGYIVTNAQLRFSLNVPDNGLIFGTAAQLPEPSTSWGLIEALVLIISFSVRGHSIRLRTKARISPG